MKKFTMGNTKGFTQTQLDSMNDDFESEMSFCESEIKTDNYEQSIKCVSERILNDWKNA